MSMIFKGTEDSLEGLGYLLEHVGEFIKISNNFIPDMDGNVNDHWGVGQLAGITTANIRMNFDTGEILEEPLMVYNVLFADRQMCRVTDMCLIEILENAEYMKMVEDAMREEEARQAELEVKKAREAILDGMATGSSVIDELKRGGKKEELFIDGARLDTEGFDIL